VAEFSRKAEDLIVRNVLIVYLGILLLLNDMDSASTRAAGIWYGDTYFAFIIITKP